MENKYCLRRAQEADYADLIDFGNYVFGIDFRALLPKLYRNHPELAADHVMVTEPGERGERIRSMVGCFKIPRDAVRLRRAQNPYTERSFCRAASASRGWSYA